MRHVSLRRRNAGFGLLEALVALVVVAVGVTALQRLVTRSIAAVELPEPGETTGATSEGLRFERVVRRAPHPALREVRVRVWPDPGAAPCELWEVIRVPPG